MILGLALPPWITVPVSLVRPMPNGVPPTLGDHGRSAVWTTAIKAGRCLHLDLVDYGNRMIIVPLCVFFHGGLYAAGLLNCLWECYFLPFAGFDQGQ